MQGAPALLLPPDSHPTVVHLPDSAEDTWLEAENKSVPFSRFPVFPLRTDASTHWSCSTRARYREITIAIL